MTTVQAQTQLGELLEMVAQAIDIPVELYERAVERYKEVGNWMCTDSSFLSEYDPEVYSQGSTRLGTNNRPIMHNEKYDFDGVARLDIAKEEVIQEELKNFVGDRLKEHSEYKKIIEEGRRCWTLIFDGTFYMDILPAIPNADGKPKSILITDKELYRWQFSNPVGYANWFKKRMVIEHSRLREKVEKRLNASVEEVPSWKIKTPLQQTVQLLKRHRDVYFQDDPEDKPISIIITTLAARAYRGEEELLAAMTQVVRHMRDYVRYENGKFVISNPVQEEENFADKWVDHPERKHNFFNWLSQLESDFEDLLRAEGLHTLERRFASMFGPVSSKEVLKQYGERLQEQRQQGNLKMAKVTGTLGTSGSTVRQHDFHGVSKTKKS